MLVRGVSGRISCGTAALAGGPVSAARGRWLGSRACTHECGGRTEDAGSELVHTRPWARVPERGAPAVRSASRLRRHLHPAGPGPREASDRGPWLPVTPPLPVAERAVASVLQVPEAKGLPKVGQGRNGAPGPQP